MGERFVFEQEIEQLKRQDKGNLARRVELVSFDYSERGFDIKSYDANGEEVHIEVKTTMATEATDPGFWLSECERQTAKDDPSWRLYRVWNIEDKPHYRNLGNVVTTLPRSWQIAPCGWFVSR